MRGSSCGWLRPRPPIPARTAGTVEAARRVAHEPMTAAGAGCPDLRQEVLSPGDVSGSPGTSRTSQIPPVSAQASPAMLREGVDLAGRPHDLPEGLQAQDFHGGWPAMCPLGSGVKAGHRPSPQAMCSSLEAGGAAPYAARRPRWRASGGVSRLRLGLASSWAGQAAPARNSSRASAGVFQPRVLRGRLLRAAATAARSSGLCRLRSERGLVARLPDGDEAGPAQTSYAI